MTLTDPQKLEVASAGVRLMSVEGYERVTLAKIRAGVDATLTPTPTDFYECFTSKERLATYWLVEQLELGQRDAATVAPGLPQLRFDEFLYRVMHMGTLRLLPEREFVEGFVRSLLVPSPATKDDIDHLVRETLKVVDEKITQPWVVRMKLTPAADPDGHHRRVVTLSISAGLLLVTLFWLSDRTAKFEDSKLVADSIAVLLALAFEPTGVQKSGREAAVNFHRCVSNNARFQSLKSILPKDLMQKSFWDILTGIYSLKP